MVNNSTNINKTIDRLWSQIIALKQANAYDVGNPGPGLQLGHAQDMAWLMGFQLHRTLRRIAPLT